MGLGRRTFLRNGFFSLSAFGFASSGIAEPEQPDSFVVPAGKCRIDGSW